MALLRGPRRLSRVAIGLSAICALGACSGSSPRAANASSSTTSAPSPAASPGSTGVSSSPPSTSEAGSGGSGVDTWAGAPVSTAAIPIGDGRVSTSPRTGYVDSCTTNFRGGGAQQDGPWIDPAAGTWNSDTKIHVQGSVSWPSASHSFTLSAGTRVLLTNDLPGGEVTGTFPIAATDPAYAYDRNPNTITTQTIEWTVPADPALSGSPSCLGLGPIGVATDGVVFFDALDAAGRDAGAHEIQDSCAGHPQAAGMYHYHTFSPCLAAASAAPGSSTLVGYALDGYGIYVERDSKGNLPTDSDLDACHGRTGSVIWDGKARVMYHYDVTTEYPYIMGCYEGTPVAERPGG